MQTVKIQIIRLALRRLISKSVRTGPALFAYVHFYRTLFTSGLNNVPEILQFHDCNVTLYTAKKSCDLVYKFKKIVGRADFSDQFRKIIVRYKRIGYNINIMRQSACLVFNPITVNNFASLFNCTPVGRASDSMMAPT